MSETDCCELPCSEDLTPSDHGCSQAEYLRVRNTLVQVLEELRLRRRTDVENEGRIRCLVKEKHQLECKYDTEVSRVASLSQKHAEQVRQIHREYEDRVRQMQEEKSRHLLCKENVEKETKALKDEIRDLQMHKFHLEKQLHDQTAKLQLQVSSAEKYLSQLSALEQKFSSVAKQYHLVLGSQGRLERNVEESMLLNRRLTYVNHHQTCLVDQCSRDLEASKQALLAARAQLQSQPAETSQAVKDLEHKVSELEAKVKQKTEEVEMKTKELATLDSHHQKTVEEVEEYHKVVANLIEAAEKRRKEDVIQTKRLEDAKAKEERIEAEVARCQQKIKADHVVYEETVEQKDAQVKDLASHLTDVEKQLLDVTKVRDKLEELNSAWAQKNLELTGQLGQLQKVVNVEKVDGYSQVELAINSTLSQTNQVDRTTSETQVPPIMTSVTPTQTATPVTSASTTQTDDTTTSCSSTQDNLCCQLEMSASAKALLRGDNLKEKLPNSQPSEVCMISNQASKEVIANNLCYRETPDIGQTPNAVTEKGHSAKDNLCCSLSWQPANQSSIASNSTDDLVPVLVSGNDSQCALEDTKAFMLESVSTEESCVTILCRDPSAHVSPSLKSSEAKDKAVTTLEKPGFGSSNIAAATPGDHSNHHSKDTWTIPVTTTVQVEVINQRTVLSSDDSGSDVRTMPAVQPSRKSSTSAPLALESKHHSTPVMSVCSTQVKTARCSGLTKPATLPSKTGGSLQAPPGTGDGRESGNQWRSLNPIIASFRVPQFCITSKPQCSSLLQNSKKAGVPQSTSSCPSLEKAQPAVFTMGSLPSSTGSTRSCQLSSQSYPPLTVTSADNSPICREQCDNTDKGSLSGLTGNSSRATDAPANETKSSPHSQFSHQLKHSYQDNQHLSNFSQIENFDVPSTPSQNPLPSAPDKSGPVEDQNMSTSSVRSTAEPISMTSKPAPLKGILKDGLISNKKTNKSVHFARVKSRCPPKQCVLTDGDTPLFSDTEDEGMELGSRMSSIQAILSPESPRTGNRKRKHQQT